MAILAEIRVIPIATPRVWRTRPTKPKACLGMMAKHMFNTLNWLSRLQTYARNKAINTPASATPIPPCISEKKLESE